AFPDGRRQGGPDHCDEDRPRRPRHRRALANPCDASRHRPAPPGPGAVGAVARMTAEPDLGPESSLVARLAASRGGRLFVQLLRWGIPVALLLIIGRRLTELGWN